jgi:hypothetical protein
MISNPVRKLLAALWEGCRRVIKHHMMDRCMEGQHAAAEYAIYRLQFCQKHDAQAAGSRHSGCRVQHDAGTAAAAAHVDDCAA